MIRAKKSTRKNVQQMTDRIKRIYTLPAYWESPLIYEDFSELDEAEVIEITEWLRNTRPGTCIGCSDSAYFALGNDANDLASLVLEFTFIRYPQEEDEKLKLL